MRALRILLWLVFALGCCIGQSPVVAAQTPLVTLEALTKDWKPYDGKRIRIRGQLDNCYHGCSLCPESMDASSIDDDSLGKCVTVWFGTTHSYGETAEEIQSAALLGETYRFATVTIEATFSSNCFAGDPAYYHLGTVISVCTDEGPPPLYAAHVLEVHSRKSAANGLAFGWVHDVVPASQEEKNGMRAAFPEEGWRWHFNSDPEPRMFVALPNAVDRDSQKRGEEILVFGVGCVCLENSCENRWPTRIFWDMNSPSNPFHCWEMQKTAQGWRILPEF